MQLVFSTWPEVEAYRAGSTGLIIPIGATEQHGPTGFIGTDAICADIIAKGVGDATGALVAPAITVGMSVHHTAFPGTMTLPPTTLVRVIMDSVFCLARQGFERFYFINGHGGNVASLQVAFWEMYSLLPTMGFANPDRIRFTFESWYELASVRAVSRELFGDAEGAHATPSEISLAMYAFPDQVKGHAPLPPTVEGRSTGYGPADFRASFPDGRLSSNPNLAAPVHGKRLLDAAVKDLAASYRRFVEEY